VPPRRLKPDYPPWLQEVVLQCLEADPLRRYPTTAHLAFDLAHPDQVRLTARSERLERDPWSVRVRRRFNPEIRPAALREIAAPLATAPIVMVAVDVTDGGEELAEAMRVTVRRLIEIVPGARFAIVNVLKHRRIGIDDTVKVFLADGGQANSLSFGPEGQLYAVSSSTGKILRAPAPAATERFC